MKKTLYVLIAVLVAADIIGVLQLANLTRDAGQTPIIHATLTRPQRAWLGALEWCESKGKPQAVNPKDLDNTPSYGLLQFKPSTFEYFAKRYGIEGSLMNPTAQEQIVTQMIVRGGIDWHQQFPGCTEKLGTPPLSPSQELTRSNKQNKITI